MIFKINYQTKKDAVDLYSNFRRSCFVEADSVLGFERIQAHLSNLTRSDFEPDSVTIERIDYFNSEDMKNMEVIKIE